MATSTFNPSVKDHRMEGEHLEKAKDACENALDKAKEAGTEALTSAKEMGAAAYDSAKDAAQSAGEMATQAATAVGNKADDWTSAAGHEVKAFGDTLGQKAPHEGLTGQASQAVADTIKGAGKYVEEAKLSGMAHDVEQVVKNHPVPALLICFGIGYCVGRMMKN